MPKHKVKSQESSIVKRFASSKLAIIGEIIILLVLVSALGKEFVRKYQIEKEIASLEDKAAALENRNTELAGLVDYFSSDDYREEEARLKLGMQKPGESVITVLGESTETDNTTAGVLEYKAPQDSRSNPERWWDYFFHSKDQESKTS